MTADTCAPSEPVEVFADGNFSTSGVMPAAWASDSRWSVAAWRVSTERNLSQAAELAAITAAVSANAGSHRLVVYSDQAHLCGTSAARLEQLAGRYPGDDTREVLFELAALVGAARLELRYVPGHGPGNHPRFRLCDRLERWARHELSARPLDVERITVDDRTIDTWEFATSPEWRDTPGRRWDRRRR